MAPAQGFDDRAPVFVISVAAELSGMHPQTLRQYDRLGLVTPQRTPGRGRRYSARDVQRLRQVQQLSQDDGVNLAGIKRILELEDTVRAMSDRLSAAEEVLSRSLGGPTMRRVFSADTEGQVTSLRSGRRPARPSPGELVLWRAQHRG